MHEKSGREAINIVSHKKSINPKRMIILLSPNMHTNIVPIYCQRDDENF